MADEYVVGITLYNFMSSNVVIVGFEKVETSIIEKIAHKLENDTATNTVKQSMFVE